jgi:hypothetical protein
MNRVVMTRPNGERSDYLLRKDCLADTGLQVQLSLAIAVA